MTAMSEKIRVVVPKLPSVFDNDEDDDGDDVLFVPLSDHHPGPSTC
jgi:hypothetical protein